jgi:endo-1,4-beta-xylanase
VGHQFHLSYLANAAEVTAALVAVENENPSLQNHVTELTVSLYNDPGSCYANRTGCEADYGANPPQAIISRQATLYRALFNAFKRPSVNSVTLWGIADNHTFYNFFPVTRTDRPLLFDANGLPKWAFWTVVDPAIVVP